MKNIRAIATAVLMIGFLSQANAQDASHCVVIKGEPQNFVNTCEYTVELGWCWVGGDCTHGTWGFSNSVTLHPGATWPAGSISGKEVKYAACKGANSGPHVDGPGEHTCDE